MQTKNCLDRGEVEIINTLGNDLTVVNAARVSFGKRKEVLDDADKKLIKYLKDNKHYSPFRHIIVQFRIKAPEFVMRQW
jgi:thymidylate synthase (FAD)